MGSRSKDALAKSIKSRSIIKDPTNRTFVETGQAAANILGSELERRLGSLNGARILDFGAGSGRIAIPLSKDFPDMRLHCTDVDAEAIDYLSQNAPSNLECSVGSYMPPLSFENDQFDAMYAVSVWSHFPHDLAISWLEEVRRVVRPGGILLISVAGINVLKHWQETTVQWKEVSESDLESEKYIYREFINLNTDEKHYPGISGEGSWGNTLVHPDYITETWGEIFTILEHRPAGMNGMQDLIILENRGN